MHTCCKPSILYFGTPVVIISTLNQNGSYNLAPISSVFWLGWRCIIGLGKNSKTAKNLIQAKECVLNLPSANQVKAVNALALTTGLSPVPKEKLQKGYRFEPNKFEISGLTPSKSKTVFPPGVKECPVQMEALVKAIYPVAEDDQTLKNRMATFELEIVNVSVKENILVRGNPNHIDPDKWRPLIMSFQEFYGLSKKLTQSVLAQIPEHLYKK